MAAAEVQFQSISPLTMITKQKAMDALAKYGSKAAAARALNMDRNAFRWALGDRAPSEMSKGEKAAAGGAVSSAPHRSASGMSRGQFAAVFDADTRTRLALRAGIRTLTNEDEIVDDMQFRTERCRRASTARWKKISEEREFAAYRFTVGGKAFWSTPATKRWAISNVEGVDQ
jgi:hypothetical protein